MQKARGLHGWIRLLEGSQTAALSGLLKELDRITSSDESSAMQLSNLILKDANLTSHIIRIGNSIQFNASTIPVTTVSRAVVNIGFKHVRSVCLAIKIMESVLCEGASELLYQRIAGSLHAANQSRNLCGKFNESQQEEAFVASLLSNLTELLILSSGQPEAEVFARKLKQNATKKERNSVAEEVLGVSLDRLSKTLMKRWRIDGLITHVYEPSSVDDRLQAIDLGDAIARSSVSGWNSSEFKIVFKKAVSFSAAPGVQVRTKIDAAVDETIASLDEFGDARLLGLVLSADAAVPKRSVAEKPVPTKASHEDAAKDLGPTQEPEEQSQEGGSDTNQEASKQHSENSAANPSSDAQLPPIDDSSVSGSSSLTSSTEIDTEAELPGSNIGNEPHQNINPDDAAPKKVLEPNQKIQLEALQKISELMLGTLQINAFMKLLLTGLNRGVGLERCAFLLFDRGHKQLSTKFVSGDGVDDWPMKLKLDYGDAKGFLASLFLADVVCLVSPEEALDPKHAADVEGISGLVKTDTFLIAPLTAQGKKVGLLYADLGSTQRAVDAARVAGFNQFLLQAKLALGVLANRK